MGDRMEEQVADDSKKEDIWIYGWRKKCLYSLVLFLIVIVTINVTLVLWIVRVLQISTHGMAHLRVVESGMEFNGKVLVMDTLVSSRLITRRGEVVSLQSGENITMRTLDRLGHVASNMYLGDGTLDINTPCFRVKDLRGKTVFSVDKDAVSLTTPSLTISGEGGAILEGSLQTPLISADIRSDLTLESSTKAVQVVTPAGVAIESRAGDIAVFSHQDINLVTIDGSIKLESGNVLFPGLKPPPSSHRLRKHHHHHYTPERIYQVCVCGTGELYLGEPDAFCEVDPVCR